MEYVVLGHSDLRISRIGFGCWAIGGYGWGKVDDRESIRAIERALELGINFFDTADVYGFGHSEKILSLGLGEQRRHVVIATKFGVMWDSQGRITRDISPGRVTQALEDSLRRLKVDCIPLYQINWPDEKTPISIAIEALNRCQKAGKIRSIGCCNLSSEQIQEAAKRHPVTSLQVPYNIVDKAIEDRILAACKEHGISVMTYGSLAQGLFSGKFSPEVQFGKEDIRSRSVYFQEAARERNFQVVKLLEEIGQRYGRTPAQVALRWILDNPDITCALTGIKTPRQIDENVGALDWTLSPDDWQLLARVS